MLRPQALLDARAAWQAGRLSEAGLSQLEDEAILTALRAQEAAGQQIYVDGEFRRTGFMTGFPDSVEGFVPDAYVPIAWKGGTGSEGASPNTQLVIGQRLRPKKRIAKNEADFLRKHAPGPFKLALPSPVNFAVIFWRQGVSDRAYETPSEFLSDAAHILASEARALAGEGTPYLAGLDRDVLDDDGVLRECWIRHFCTAPNWLFASGGRPRPVRHKGVGSTPTIDCEHGPEAQMSRISEVMSPLRMAAAAAARPSSVSSCTSEIDARLAGAFSFCMDISLEAGAKRSGEGVAMLGYESFNGERGPSPDLFDEIVGPGEHPVRVVDGDLAQVLHQELAAGPAGNPVGFGIK